MPDVFFSSKDEIPEGLREFAKEGEDGKFTVNVVAKVKLDEFRENNTNLAKERDSLREVAAVVKKLFGEDFEPTKAEEELLGLRDIAQQVKDGKLTGKRDIEEAVAERVKTMKDGYENQIKEKGAEAATWKTKYEHENTRFKRTLIDRAILDVILDDKVGAQPSAKEDILTRAYSVFHVDEEGKLTPKAGDAVLYGADGATPMSPGEWVTSLKEKSPHLFKSSNGGGTGAGAEKRFGGFSKEDYAKLSPAQKLEIANGDHQR